MMEDLPEWIVTFEVWVTAKDVSQAAEYALADLRDPQLLGWKAKVVSIEKWAEQGSAIEGTEVQIDSGILAGADTD